MSAHRVVMAVALGFIAFFAFLTIYAALDRGFTILTVVSIGILGLLLVGVLGALLQGPRD